jgi:hypothetical protein
MPATATSASLLPRGLAAGPAGARSRKAIEAGAIEAGTVEAVRVSGSGDREGAPGGAREGRAAAAVVPRSKA